MPTILAIDLGTVTGWACAQSAAVDVWPRGFVEKGPIDGVQYGERRHPSAGNLSGVMLDAFRVWLAQMLSELAPTHIVYESVFINRFRTSSMRLSEMRGIIEATAHGCHIALFEANNKTWKKHFTGTGSATKEQTIWMCKQRGWTPQGDNAADALGILDYAVHCIAPNRRKQAWQHGSI